MYSRPIQTGCSQIVLVASLVLSGFKTEGEITGPRQYFKPNLKGPVLGQALVPDLYPQQDSVHSTQSHAVHSTPNHARQNNNYVQDPNFEQKRRYYPTQDNAARKTLHHKPSNLALDPVWNEVLEDGPRNNSKRAALDLYNMIKCATGCNPLVYKGYGCYCGFLGSGGVVDGIDRCCKMHDWCYSVSSCILLDYNLPYFVPYKWTCNGGSPYCMPGRTKKTSRGSCSHQLCECDQEFVECLSDFPCPHKKAMCKSPWRYWQNLFMGLGTGMPMLESNDIHGPQHHRKPKMPFKYPKPQFYKNKLNIAFG